MRNMYYKKTFIEKAFTKKMLTKHHSPSQVFVHDLAISYIVSSSLVPAWSNHAVESCPGKPGKMQTKMLCLSFKVAPGLSLVDNFTIVSNYNTK